MGNATDAKKAAAAAAKGLAQGPTATCAESAKVNGVCPAAKLAEDGNATDAKKAAAAPAKLAEDGNATDAKKATAAAKGLAEAPTATCAESAKVNGVCPAPAAKLAEDP